MKIRCMFNHHRWGRDAYVVETFLRPQHAFWGPPEFDGEMALAMCRDCDALKYLRVSMARAVHEPVNSERKS